MVDRSSGEVLSAEAFAPVNATSGVDRRSKVLIRNPDKGVRRGQMTRDICPARPGAVTGASAFLPETGLLYIPSRRLCMDLEARTATTSAARASRARTSVSARQVTKRGEGWSAGISRRRGPPGPCPSAFRSPAACSR